MGSSVPSEDAGKLPSYLSAMPEVTDRATTTVAAPPDPFESSMLGTGSNILPRCASLYIDLKVGDMTLDDAPLYIRMIALGNAFYNIVSCADATGLDSYSKKEKNLYYFSNLQTSIVTNTGFLQTIDLVGKLCGFVTSHVPTPDMAELFEDFTKNLIGNTTVSVLPESCKRGIKFVNAPLNLMIRMIVVTISKFRDTHKNPRYEILIANDSTARGFAHGIMKCSSLIESNAHTTVLEKMGHALSIAEYCIKQDPKFVVAYSAKNGGTHPMVHIITSCIHPEDLKRIPREFYSLPKKLFPDSDSDYEDETIEVAKTKSTPPRNPPLRLPRHPESRKSPSAGLDFQKIQFVSGGSGGSASSASAALTAMSSGVTPRTPERRTYHRLPLSPFLDTGHSASLSHSRTETSASSTVAAITFC
jgi:hypothetical protein